MSDEILLKVMGSNVHSNSRKQELMVKESGVKCEIAEGLKLVKSVVPYHEISQVVVHRGLTTADLELVSSGNRGSLVVRALPLAEAEEAKRLIEQKLSQLAQLPLASTTLNLN